MLHLQKEIHEKVLGMSSSDDDDECVIPKFISYDSNCQGGNSAENESINLKESSELLPDGLHVDTNNGNIM